MRKIKLIFVLLLISIIVNGCSGNSSPFNRKHNAKNDQIKFYGFEWLTELKTITDKFDKDFGKDTYETELTFTGSIGSSSTEVYSFFITGKNGSNLLWKIAGHEVKRIELSLFSKDGGKHCYLTGGTYYFKESDEVMKDIKDKLGKLYTFNEQGNVYDGSYIIPLDEKDNAFIDNNGNYIRFDDRKPYELHYHFFDGDLIFFESMNDNNTNTDNKNDMTGL